MLFPELEETPPNRRMSRFLELSFEYRKSTPAQLAEKLGYKRDTTVVQWMRGSAKVPLRHLSTISNFFSHDIAHVLSAWLRSGMPGRLPDRVCCGSGDYHLGVATRLRGT